MKRMHLEDAFEDNPGTQNLLKLIEEDALFVKDYSTVLHSHLNRVLNAQNDLCNALGSLSHHLKAYREIGSYKKSDFILPETLLQFASRIDDLSSINQILISQIADGLPPLKKFVVGDISELFQLKEVFMASKNEMNKIHGNHLKFSKKREKEKQAKDLEDEVFVGRKKFHEAALKYYTSLNGMQLKKTTCLIEPLLHFARAHLTYFELSSEFVNKLRTEDFIGNTEVVMQKISDEIRIERIRSVDSLEQLEQNSVQKYFVESPVETFISHLNIKQKAGYLMLRSKGGLLASKWDQYYFFIQGGCLMYQGSEEMAGRSIADLEIETNVETCDVDDRRYVFSIHQPSIKKNITLQGESYRGRDEWVSAILNASKECCILAKNVDLGLTRGTQNQTTLEDDASLNVPIQFDIITPCHDNESRSEAAFESVDPLDESGKMRTPDGSKVDVVGKFQVSFLGSQQVSADGGDKLLKETMRKILAARALHNVFKMPLFDLLISNQSLVLANPQANQVKSVFKLEDVSYWGIHDDNKRLFGFMSRSRNVDEAPIFTCHVFECNSGEEICNCFTSATQMAYEAFLKKGELNEETELLLRNICESKDEGPQKNLSTTET